MGKWGNQSSWAKDQFDLLDPQCMHRLRQAKAKRVRPGEGEEKESADALLDELIPFQCKRCKDILQVGRTRSTGRPCPDALVKHLEKDCKAGITTFAEALGHKETVQSECDARDYESMKQFLESDRAATKDTLVMIALANPKTPQNMGSVLRAISVYTDGDAVLYTGNRYDVAVRFSTHPHDDGTTMRVHFGDFCPVFQAMRDCALQMNAEVRVVAVDLLENACSLHEFDHERWASTSTGRRWIVYVFGPEDGTIPPETLKACDAACFVPTKGSMNLAATVNVLLYDRQAKRLRAHPELLPSLSNAASASRNVNNHLSVEGCV